MNPIQDIPPREASAPAPVARRPPRPQRTIENIYAEIKDELKLWLRSAAAYAILNEALNTRKSGGADASRKRAAPLFHTPPISFAGEEVELCFDTNKYPDNEFEWALIPHSNGQVANVTAAMDNLSRLIAELRVSQRLPPVAEAVLDMLATAAPPQAPPPPVQQG